MSVVTFLVRSTPPGSEPSVTCWTKIRLSEIVHLHFDCLNV